MSDRLELFKRISDYLFASYRWGCMNSPGVLAPKPLGVSVDLLEYQRQTQPKYGAYCEIFGRNSRGTSILDYPPIPAECFRCTEMSSFPAEQCLVEFHEDSGKVIHRFCDTGLMQRSQIYAFTLMIARIMSPTTRIFSLLPSSRDARYSQASFMVTSFVDTLGSSESAHFNTTESGLDSAGLIEALEKASNDKAPVHLMGTLGQYKALLEALGDRTIASEPGSCAMQIGETGAFYSRNALLEIREELSRKLGISRRCIYGEFGRSEFSSQGYEICALNGAGEDSEEGLYIFPNWVKCMVFNPDTLAPLLPGNPGRIAIFDLCNLDSAAFVLTEEEGELITLSESLRSRVQGHPKYALKVHGSSSNAIPEGCLAPWKTWTGRIVV